MVLENLIKQKMEVLRLKMAFVAGLSQEFNIPGASEASMSKAMNGAKDLPNSTALSLDNLLKRFIDMTTAFEPFKIRFESVSEAKLLLTEFEAGILRVSVERITEPEHIRGAVCIEFLDDQSLFAGMSTDGTVTTTRDKSKASYMDEITSSYAVDILRHTRPCRACSVRLRIAETKIVKSIQALGFAEKVELGLAADKDSTPVED